MSSETVYGLVEVVTFIDGVRAVVHRDEPWNADDPVVRARPDLFSDAPSKIQSTVERATQAPGEKRNTRRGKSSD